MRSPWSKLEISSSSHDIAAEKPKNGYCCGQEQDHQQHLGGATAQEDDPFSWEDVIGELADRVLDPFCEMAAENDGVQLDGLLIARGRSAPSGGAGGGSPSQRLSDDGGCSCQTFGSNPGTMQFHTGGRQTLSEGMFGDVLSCSHLSVQSGGRGAALSAEGGGQHLDNSWGMMHPGSSHGGPSPGGMMLPGGPSMTEMMNQTSAGLSAAPPPFT